MKYKHLYVITRSDLAPGYQGVQSQHAIAEFAFNYPDTFKHWRINSNYLSWLVVKDEDQLKKLAIRLGLAKIKIVAFFEPDTFFQMTALAAEPGYKSKQMLKNLPLALKGLK